MAGDFPFVARARTDDRDWLVEADEPLAGMHLRNGGEIPGPILAPALLELVRKARLNRVKLANAVEARDQGEAVSAWAEAEPDADGQGCVVGLTHWHSEPAAELDPAGQREHRLALIQHTAELTARLGPAQELLGVESDSEELQDLLGLMRDGNGRPWTDFVSLENNSDGEPLDWRLLDGAKLRLGGSQRCWTAHLVPLRNPPSGSTGFELYLAADAPLPECRPAEGAKDAEPGEFTAIGRDIAAMLRQPVSRIIANAETIETQLAGPLAEEYSKYAADIASAGEHFGGLIEEFATLEELEDENFSPAPERIDLADIARRSAGILRVRAQERGISVRVPRPDERAVAIGEFRRVMQILVNLLGNAIRYSPEGSEVWLRIEQDDKFSRVIVADQGEGLDPDEQARVFAKFERLGRKGDGGSGLGLYISRRLAETMNGALRVESAKGQGARFILELPADRGPAD